MALLWSKMGLNVITGKLAFLELATHLSCFGVLQDFSPDS